MDIYGINIVKIHWKMNKIQPCLHYLAKLEGLKEQKNGDFLKPANLVQFWPLCKHSSKSYLYFQNSFKNVHN